MCSIRSIIRRYKTCFIFYSSFRNSDILVKTCIMPSISIIFNRIYPPSLIRFRIYFPTTTICSFRTSCKIRCTNRNILNCTTRSCITTCTCRWFCSTTISISYCITITSFTNNTSSFCSSSTSFTTTSIRSSIPRISITFT